MAKTLTELETQRRYRERNRDALREEGREYSRRKRRDSGIPALGTPESIANRRAARKATGPEHGNWKGDDAGYDALHKWVALHKDRAGVCSECGIRPRPKPSGFRQVATEWANVNGEYRRDLDDWIELCIPCHRRRDTGGIKHGTPGAYSYHRCRCDACRRSHRDRARDYVRRKLEALTYR